MRIITIGLSAFLIGCEAARESTESVTVTQVDTVIDSESAIIAFAIDVEVDSSGIVYVADSRANQVLRLDPNAGSSRSFG